MLAKWDAAGEGRRNGDVSEERHSREEESFIDYNQDGEAGRAPSRISDLHHPGPQVSVHIGEVQYQITPIIPPRTRHTSAALTVPHRCSQPVTRRLPLGRVSRGRLRPRRTGWRGAGFVSRRDSPRVSHSGTVSRAFPAPLPPRPSRLNGRCQHLRALNQPSRYLTSRPLSSYFRKLS